MKKPIHVRQGDVLIERIAALPKNLTAVPRESGRVILAHGEATGHAHAISEPNVYLHTAAEHAGVTFLEIHEAVAALVHDEHTSINLERGVYRVVRQQEYTPQEIRRVAD